MAVWGFGQGLIAGGLALVGFGLGAFLGSRLGPVLLSEGSHSPYAPLVALIVALVLGAVFASVLEVAGFHLSRRLPGELGLVDGIGGGGAGGGGLPPRGGAAGGAGSGRGARG